MRRYKSINFLGTNIEILLILSIVVVLTYSIPYVISAELHVLPGESIQAAINEASNGDTILVAEGTYTGKGNRDIDFGGKAIILRSISGPEHTIIDCQGTSSKKRRGFYFHMAKQ
ncbi:MAG: hypothetical protein ACMUJM_16775 [bacterium]